MPGSLSLIMKIRHWGRFLIPAYFDLFTHITVCEQKNRAVVYSDLQQLSQLQHISLKTLTARMNRLGKSGLLTSQGRKLKDRSWGFSTEGRQFYELYLQYAPNLICTLSPKAILLLLILPQNEDFQNKQLFGTSHGWSRQALKQALSSLARRQLLERTGIRKREIVYRLNENGIAVQSFYKTIWKQWAAKNLQIQEKTENEILLHPFLFFWITEYGLVQLALLHELKERYPMTGYASEIGNSIGTDPSTLADKLWELSRNGFAGIRQKSRKEFLIILESSGEKLVDALTLTTHLHINR